MFSQFFIHRPIFATVIALAVVFRRRERHAAGAWSDVVAPHLLRHLVVRSGKQPGIRPQDLVPPVLAIAVLAMAGPA